jgi:hypothetical protein
MHKKANREGWTKKAGRNVLTGNGTGAKRETGKFGIFTNNNNERIRGGTLGRSRITSGGVYRSWLLSAFAARPRGGSDFFSSRKFRQFGKMSIYPSAPVHQSI